MGKIDCDRGDLTQHMSESNLTPEIPCGTRSSAIATAEALLQAYGAGRRNFMGVDLMGVQLSHADLKGSNLSYADFSAADLSHANLRGVDLSYADLSSANLSGADLRGAMLIGTNLRDAILESATLESADYDPTTTHFPTGFNPDKAGLRADR